MPSRRLGIAALLVALLTSILALVGATPALADDVVALANAADHAPDGTVRVLVQLDASAAPAAIDRAVAGALDDTDVDDIANVRTYDSLPFLAADVDAAGIEDLARSDDVVSVVRDVTLRPTLDASIAHVQGDLASAGGWTAAGSNIAVVDTGVDSQHEFLSGKITADG